MAEDDEGAARDGPEVAYDVGRLLAFSDGVFAIAITLLVLNIPVPNLASPTAGELTSALLGLKPNLGGYALSFFLVGTYWVGHHRLLRHAHRFEGPGLWLNLFVLATVCLIPFSAGVLIRYGSTVPGFWVYAGNQVLAGLGFLLLRLEVRRTGAPVPGSTAATSLMAPVFLASMPVALWDVRMAFGVWFLGAALSRLVTSRRPAWLGTRSLGRLRAGRRAGG